MELNLLFCVNLNALFDRGNEGLLGYIRVKAMC